MVLMAGIMALESESVSVDGVGFTNEGVEKSFAVNYIANVLLVIGLLGQSVNLYLYLDFFSALFLSRALFPFSTSPHERYG